MWSWLPCSKAAVPILSGTRDPCFHENLMLGGGAEAAGRSPPAGRPGAAASLRRGLVLVCWSAAWGPGTPDVEGPPAPHSSSAIHSLPQQAAHAALLGAPTRASTPQQSPQPGTRAPRSRAAPAGVSPRRKTHLTLARCPEWLRYEVESSSVRCRLARFPQAPCSIR